MTSKLTKAGRRVLVICGLLASTSAGAATDLETLQKQIGKSAPFAFGYPERPKGACMCRSTVVSGISFRGGVLRQQFTGGATNRVTVECVVPSFDANGTMNGYAACQDFVALPN